MTVQEAQKKKMSARWYIVIAHSGFEHKVAQAIKERSAKKDLTSCFEEILVPTETVVEVKKGKKTDVERKFFPGYVLVKMDMNDETWHLVKDTPRVSGFLGGGGNRPQPITESEVDRILEQVREGKEAPKRSVQFDIGEEIKIIDGPFDTFNGVVSDMNDEKQTLKVEVSIFGRSTPVELSFDQVEKI